MWNRESMGIQDDRMPEISFCECITLVEVPFSEMDDYSRKGRNSRCRLDCRVIHVRDYTYVIELESMRPAMGTS